MAEATKDTEQSTVLLVDKASLRHKKDNKIEDRNSVQRIRADISDLDLEKLEAVQLADNIVAVGKHLCGGATDLTLRCLINGNEIRKNVKGFVIALCCHHRCTWRPFVGKKFLLDNGITQNEFDIMTKMVGWAVCGTGISRQLRKEIEMRNEQKGILSEVFATSIGDLVFFYILQKQRKRKLPKLRSLRKYLEKNARKLESSANEY